MSAKEEGPNKNVLIDKNWWKMWRNRRYHVSIMCFLGLVNMYTCRVNMSVAVVAMTKVTTSTDNATTQDFDWSSSEKSIVLSSFYYGYVPIQVFAGMLLKYISPHIVYGIGAALPGLLTILIPIISKYLPFWVLVTTRVLMGIFQGVAIPCLMKFWTVWAPPLERARLHGIAIAGAFVGTVVGLPLSGLLADHIGWESIFYVIGAVCLVWYAIWLILIRESPEKDFFISKYEKHYILTTIGEQKETITRNIPWLSISRSMPVYGVLAASLGWGWGYVTMLTHLPQFLSDVMNFDLSKSGILSALPYLSMTVMTLCSGYLADYILVRQLLTVTKIRKYFISFAMIVQAIFIIAAAYVTNPTLNIVCISLGIGVGALSYSGIGINYIDIGPAFAAIIGGLGNTLTTLPGIVSPLMTGLIVQVSESNKLESHKSEYDQLLSEWRIVFFITAGMYLAGSIIYWFLGSAEAQSWGKFTQNEENVESPSEECNKSI